MSVQSEKNKKTILQWLIPSIVLIVFILFTTMGFERDMEKKYTEDVIGEFQSAISGTAEACEREVAIGRTMCKVFADYMGSEGMFRDYKQLQRVLSAIENNNAVDAAFYINQYSELIDSSGAKTTPEEALDHMASEFLNEGAFLCSKESECFYAYGPVTNSNGRLVVRFNLKDIDEIKPVTNNVASNGNTATYFIMDIDGNIMDVTGAGSKNYQFGDNLFDKMGRVSYLGGAAEATLKKKMRNGGYYTALYQDANGNNRYLMVKKMESVNGVVGVTVSEAQVSKVANIRNKPTRVLTLKVIVCMAIFIGAIVLISILNMANVNIRNKDLQEQAETDLLTDLYNKITTERKINEYLTGEGKDKLGMMFLLDIDNFKKINDTMGHAFGDEVLSELGHQLRAEFRVTDIVGRLGGDEFVIFLKDLKEAETMKREAHRVEEFFKNFGVHLKCGIDQATNIPVDLRENYHIFCSMVIYPVIPKGMVIFRIVSTAAHTMEDVEYTLNAFKEIKAKLDRGEYDGDDIAAMTVE